MCKHVEHCNNVFHQRKCHCVCSILQPRALYSSAARQEGRPHPYLQYLQTAAIHSLYQFDVFSPNEQLRYASQHSPNTGEHLPVASLGQHSVKMFHDDIFIANSNFSSFVTNDTEHSAEAASSQRNIHSCPRCAQSSASSPHCVRTCPKFQPSAMFRQRSQLATAIGYIFQESDYLLEFTCNQQYLIDI